MTINTSFPLQATTASQNQRHIKNPLYDESDSIIDYIARYYRNMKERAILHGNSWKISQRSKSQGKVTKQGRRGMCSRLREEMCDGKEERNSTGQQCFGKQGEALAKVKTQDCSYRDRWRPSMMPSEGVEFFSVEDGQKQGSEIMTSRYSNMTPLEARYMKFMRWAGGWGEEVAQPSLYSLTAGPLRGV